jgi:hypothetical protein
MFGKVPPSGGGRRRDVPRMMVTVGTTRSTCGGVGDGEGVVAWDDGASVGDDESARAVGVGDDPGGEGDAEALGISDPIGP